MWHPRWALLRCLHLTLRSLSVPFLFLPRCFGRAHRLRQWLAQPHAGGLRSGFAAESPRLCTGLSSSCGTAVLMIHPWWEKASWQKPEECLKLKPCLFSFFFFLRIPTTTVLKPWWDAEAAASIHAWVYVCGEPALLAILPPSPLSPPLLRRDREAEKLLTPLLSKQPCILQIDTIQPGQLAGCSH